MNVCKPALPLRLTAVACVCVALALPLAAIAAAPEGAKGVTWQMASGEADVDKAFELARRTGKPVFLYWGAVWCPPCHQVRATVFSRPDFAERSRAFVPVYVDGDKPGAQKVAARYKVSGYPTMILFKPDGTEVTRLPGEVDPERYLQALTSGMDAQVPVKELVQRGLGGQVLTPEQWRLLAFYSWDTDEQQVLPAKELPAKLDQLASHVPKDLTRVQDRLAFKAIVARASSSPVDAAAREVDRRTVERFLDDAGAARELFDLFVGQANRVARYVSAGREDQKAFAARWESVIAKMPADGLSRSDQLDVLYARMALWKLSSADGSLDAERRQAVLKEVARVVAATPDKYERQAVVPNASYVLAQAGMLDESDALLKAELPRAVAPYYHMLGLAGNAKARGDAKSAVHWYEQAWQKSEGPATRIQWGSTYVNQLAELAPTDVAKVSDAASGVLSALEPKPETFYGRTQRSLERMAKKLVDWQGSDAKRVEVVSKLKVQLAKTCAKLPAKDAGRANCDKVFSAPAA
jgi:thioredoxin-related protein